MLTQAETGGGENDVSGGEGKRLGSQQRREF